MGGGTSSQQASSDFIVKQFENISPWFGQQGVSESLGYGSDLFRGATPQDLAFYQMAKLAGGSPYSSPVGSAYESALLNPSFDTTTSQQALLDASMAQVGGQTAINRMGMAPTQTELLTAVSPLMNQFQQQQVSNLGTAKGLEIQNLMAQLGGLGTLAQGIEPTRIGGSESQSSGSGTEVSLCCFIFLNAYNGVLDSVVRKYRDEYMTPRNRRGYYRIADKIVPVMKQNTIVKNFVKWIMCDPMVAYGKFHYGNGHYIRGSKPVTKFWLKIFDLFGAGTYLRKNGEVV